MALELLTNFRYKGKLPNFERDQFKTIEEMVHFPEYYLPDTFVATCIEDGNAYLFNRKNPYSVKLGRWRILNGNGSADAINAADITDLFES